MVPGIVLGFTIFAQNLTAPSSLSHNCICETSHNNWPIQIDYDGMSWSIYRSMSIILLLGMGWNRKFSGALWWGLQFSCSSLNYLFTYGKQPIEVCVCTAACFMYLIFFYMLIPDFWMYDDTCSYPAPLFWGDQADPQGVLLFLAVGIWQGLWAVVTQLIFHAVVLPWTRVLGLFARFPVLREVPQLGLLSKSAFLLVGTHLTSKIMNPHLKA